MKIKISIVGIIALILLNLVFLFGFEKDNNYGFDDKYEVKKDSEENLSFTTSASDHSADLIPYGHSKKFTTKSDFIDASGNNLGAWTNMEDGYIDTNYFANYYFVDNDYKDGDGIGSLTTLSHENEKYFDDDGIDNNGQTGNGEEIKYSEWFDIILAPNIVTAENIKISFSTYDMEKTVDDESGFGDTFELHASTRHQDGIPLGYAGDDVIENLEITNKNESNDIEHSGYKQISDTEYFDNNPNAFDGNDVFITRNIRFRATYEDNPKGVSDRIIIWTTGNSYNYFDGDAANLGLNEEYNSSQNNLNCFKTQQFNDENFTPLRVEGTFYLDTIDGANIKINESLFMQMLSQSILDNENKLYYETYNYNSSSSSFDIENINAMNYDMIDFKYTNVTYKNLIEILFVNENEEGKTLFEESIDYSLGTNIEQEFFQFKFDPLNNDSDIYNETNNDDDFIYCGDGTITDVNGIESDNTWINETIKSSALTFTINRNSNYEGIYGNSNYYSNNVEVPFGLYNDDEINNGNNTISLNLPFYHWKINTIPTWVNKDTNELQTMFGESAAFNIEVADNFYQKDIYLDIDTNTNLEININDDSNIYSIFKNGTQLLNDGTNSWKINTNFEDDDAGLDEYQEETYVITYKQKINDSDTTSKISQKVHLTIKYDSDSIVTNGSESEAVEMLGSNQQVITSVPIAVSKNKDELFLEDGDFNIIDYYEAKSDFSWIFSDEQYSLLSETFDYKKYTKNSTNEIIENSINDVSTQNQLTFYGDLNGSLLNTELKLKNSNKYNYWINISNQFIDYGEDDNLSSNNHIPIEWKELIGSVIKYDEENKIYSIEYNSNIYYLKDFYSTPRGELFREKSSKKGWSYSDVARLQSYMFESLEFEWETLIQFSDLNINAYSLSLLTSDLESKKHYKFVELRNIWDEEIEEQLYSEELQGVNVLEDRDFQINYYLEDGETSIPDNLIIDSNTKIIVKIESKKYGNGIGEYEFSFNPIMIEPLPLWIKIFIAFVLVFVIIFIFLIAYGLYWRNKNSKISA